MTLEPYDDPSISNDDFLVRRVNPEEHVVPDENIGGRRLSRKAFALSSSGSKGMSVDIKNDIELAGHVVAKYVMSPKYTASVEFQTAIPRSMDLWVGKEPLPENPFHGEIWKVTGSSLTKGQQNTLLRNSQWLVPIDGVSLI